MCLIGWMKHDFDAFPPAFFYSRILRPMEVLQQPRKHVRKHPKIYAKTLVDGDVHVEHKHGKSFSKPQESAS